MYSTSSMASEPMVAPQDDYLPQSAAMSAQNSAQNSTNNSDGSDSKSLPTSEEQPKKKRKSTVRACDGCAIRKVKCEVQRPCKHCIANGLECTLLRERKKLGPKNLHKKTLDTINKFLRSKDANRLFDMNYKKHPESSIIASNHNEHPIELLPDSLTGSLATSDGSGSSKFTTEELVLVLKLIKEPIIGSVLKEVVVRLLLANHEKLIDFIHENMNNLSLDLILNLTDPVYLSKILVVLSLVLEIAENCIILILTNSKHPFLRPIEYYRDLKRITLFKIIEIFQMIDKLLLYPIRPTSQHQVFYNQSVSSHNICNYFSLTRDHDQLYVSQQKVMYLRKAITYYQLLNDAEVNSTGAKTLNHFQITELFEKLFLTERYNYLTSTHLINSTNLFDLNMSINTNSLLFRMFKIINNDPMIFHRLKSHNVLMSLHNFYKINHYPDSNNLLTKNYLNLRMGLLEISKNDHFSSILNCVVLFKVLMIYSNNLELNVLAAELIEIVNNLNKLLKFSDVIHIKFCCFNLLPQLMQILKINIDFENNLTYLPELLTYTKNLLPFFNTTKDIDGLLKSNKILYDWFEGMGKLNTNELFSSLGNFNSVPTTSTNSYSSPMNAPRTNSDPPTERSHTFDKKQAPPPQQLQQHLNKLQKSQTDMQNLQRSVEDNKDRADIADLMQDFGNSRLSSNTSTNTNSTIVTNCPTPDVDSDTPRYNGTLPQNVNSASYSTIIQPSVPTALPPPVPSQHMKKEPSGMNLNLNVSESTKNLYNLFTQMNDDVPSQNNSLTNLLQFNNSSNNVANLNNLNKISSLSNLRLSNNLKLISSNSTLNLFMAANTPTEDDDEKRRNLKNQFLL